MRGFATSSNPFVSGLRPKRFLNDRVAMLRREKMLKKLDPKAYESKVQQRPQSGI